MSISLKHIAEAAGVSRTTVSLALRNHPRIPEATRKRIRQLADELGYVPNADVSKVMGMIRENKTHRDYPVLGLLTDMQEPMSQQKDPGETWLGFQERALALGYRPEEFWVGDHRISPDRLQGILHARGIRGLVVSALREPAFLSGMDLSTLACACIGHAVHEPHLHRASSDKYTNTLLGCEKLWAQGCRRIGLAIPKVQEDRVENLFLSGYLVFQHLHHHAGWKTPLVEEGPWNLPRIADWAVKQKLDGIIAAYPGLDALLPGVKVALVNVLRNDGTGMRQCHDRIAAGAVDLVDAQLRRNEFGIPALPKTMLVVGSWVEQTR